MTVEIWYGRKPETRAEQHALVELYQFLNAQAEHYLVLVQFHAGKTNEIDWVVIKQNGIFVVELKDVGDANRTVYGRSEGTWIVSDPVTESEFKLGKNPFKQVKYNFWHFADWCKDNADKIADTPDRAARLDFKEATHTYVVITPDLNEASDIQVPPYVPVLGQPKFMTTLVVVGTTHFQLSPKEMERIPELLELERWDIALPAAEQEDEDVTIRLDEDWEVEPFTGLVALGHNLSVPMLNLERLNKENITIGRDTSNDLSIEDETVSRFHARITQQDGWYVLEDLGSTSGTYVNYKGEPGSVENHLSEGMTNRLRNHSTVRFGAIRYMFLVKQ